MDSYGKKALERMQDARDFPTNTCTASQHTAMIAEALIKGEAYSPLQSEPAHCGWSIAVSVASLWALRTQAEGMMRSINTLTAERDAALARAEAAEAEVERLKSERPYIVGWNDGFAFATSAREHPEEHMHSEGAADIARERERQIRSEGWTPEHDDKYTQSQLPDAARCYLEGSMWGWPSDWDKSWWKPKGRRADLVRAGALIAAEIDRMDRAALQSGDRDND